MADFPDMLLNDFDFGEFGFGHSDVSAVVTLSFAIGVEDLVPPTIALVGPPQGSALSKSSEVTFDVTDDQLLRDVWVFVVMADTWEVVWGGEPIGFSPAYSGSSRTTLTSGHRFVVKRRGGWFAAPSFHITAIDRGGNAA